MNLFSRRPSWLFNALGLTQPDLPVRLETAYVAPTVDVFQQGWGNGFWATTRTIIPQGTVANTDTIHIEAADGLIRLVPGSVIEHINGAAATRVRISINDTVTGFSTVLREVSMAPGEQLQWADLQTGHPWVIPPGHTLQLRNLDALSGAAESVRFYTQALETEAGFKVL